MDDINKIAEKLSEFSRPSVRIEIGGKPTGRSHFGGLPDLPDDAEYPSFVCSTFEDDEELQRPLHFLAQIDCAEASKFDKSGLLPKSGLLLFFYRCDSSRWGFDPEDRGSARVIYVESPGRGKIRKTPGDVEVFPELGLEYTTEISYPDFEQLYDMDRSLAADYEKYEAARQKLGVDEPQNCHKLLGWPDTIQGAMELECELVSRGYYLGHGYPKLPDMDKISRDAIDEWLLLFQLDTVSDGDFELMFGDCGRIYFFIRREDLAARRFDDVWMVLQCG